jgi:hypothetical protein
LFFCIIPFLSYAQRDVLILQKRGMHVRSYTVDDQLTFETVYGQWFTGVINDLRRDTIYINGQAFSYKEVAAIQRARSGSFWGAAMLAGGAGYLAIGGINGMIRKDAAKDWYTSTDLIISGALIAGGVLLTAMKSKYYHIGRKYRLIYLQIGKR